MAKKQVIIVLPKDGGAPQFNVESGSPAECEDTARKLAALSQLMGLQGGDSGPLNPPPKIPLTDEETERKKVRT